MGFEDDRGGEREMTTPRISVIVPASGPAPGLEKCLKAVENQRLKPHEVILVDNGLQGGAERVLACLPGALVVRVEKVGSYAARNGGLGKATGEILAFTDSDCEPAPHWLEGAVEKMDETGAELVAGPVEVTASPLPSRSPTEVLELKFAFPQESYVRKQGFGVTANLVGRRIVFETAGSFDEELLSGGDFEWGQRAGSAGFPVCYAPRALVRHPARKTPEELFEKERRVSLGIHRLARAGRFKGGRFLRMALWSLSPPVMAVWKVLSDPSLGDAGLRLRAVGLLLRVRGERLKGLAGQAWTEGEA